MTLPADPAPDRVIEAVHDAMTVEFATASDGRPQTFPLTPFWDDHRERIVVTSPPAYAGKVEDAKTAPRVALLADRGDHELLVRGDATVYDTDTTANRRYVRRLIDDQPDGFKRDVFQESNALIRSPIGWLLLGWYSLRVVVAIDPTDVDRLPSQGPPAVDAWPAAEMGQREAESYARAVFTAVDDGDPVSRPVASVDVDDDGGASLALPDPPAVDDGQPACLLLHWHSDDVADLRQRLVRGRAAPAGDGTVRFRAGSTFSMRNESALDTLSFIAEGKRRTFDYFDADGGPLDWIRY